MVNILQFCVTVYTDTYIALAQSLSFEKLCLAPYQYLKTKGAL